MELVNGLPLNKFCDEAKLTLQQRLELFVPICQAVRHAHHKGMVRRDLKPSNILVTLIDGRPVPKVIDFGMAEATAGKLTDESLETQFGAVVGTLNTCLLSKRVSAVPTSTPGPTLTAWRHSTRTAHRAAADRRPALKKAAYTEMLRIMRKKTVQALDPPLDRQIVALDGCLATDRTAEADGHLAWRARLGRHEVPGERPQPALRNRQQPRPRHRTLPGRRTRRSPAPSGCRLRKFLLRHKGPVLAASLLLLALVGGIVGAACGEWCGQNNTAYLQNDGVSSGRRAKQPSRSEAVRADAKAQEASDNANAALENANRERLKRGRATRKPNWPASLYTAHMNMAQLLGRCTNRYVTGSTRPAAAAAGEDLRGYEWHYWDRVCHSYLAELKGGGGGVFKGAGGV